MIEAAIFKMYIKGFIEQIFRAKYLKTRADGFRNGAVDSVFCPPNLRTSSSLAPNPNVHMPRLALESIR